MESINEMWNLVCDELRRSLNSDVIYNIWFAPIEIVSFDGEKIELAVSEFKRTTIEKQFGQNLRDAVKTVLGFDAEIVMVDPEVATATIHTTNTAPDKTVSGTESNTFDSFVVGPSNRFAYQAAKATAEKPGGDFNPLYIYGSSGLGKTHLMCAIRNYILEKTPDANIMFTRGEDFVNMIVEGIRTKNMNYIHDRYRNCDILLLDDIQFIAGKQQTQEEFFHTFNALTADGKQIVVTSDVAPKEISNLEERIRTRLESGLIADISAPDFETRMAIIQRKAASLGFDIPQDVVEYIAEKVKTNIRQLEGAVKKIHALVNLEGTSISIAMAQSAIKDLASEGLPVDELVKKLIAETSRTYSVPVEDLCSKKKDAKTAKARQIAIYCIRECTELTQQDISEYFGGRDRTAIHYAIEKTAPLVEKDSALRKVVENIMKNAREQ
ncbi:MAG: chromosomal replication initiator protein DnaA [Clostridia bacterium]|nr:chromosomal replication initiator protein DnaA [Clostridia bacterium]